MRKKIDILVDNDSWILPYAAELADELKSMGYTTKLVRKVSDLESGWVCFFLGCTQIVNDDVLDKHEYNLVVHESDLPEGKGFAPMAWQILEGKEEITFCLFEATNKVDAGRIWIKESISLSGYELNNEWRDLQGEKTKELCLKFVNRSDEMVPQEQEGVATFYKRRGPKDSQLDIDKSIREQFNLLRVVDNENYPAFVLIGGKKLILSVEWEEVDK